MKNLLLDCNYVHAYYVYCVRRGVLIGRLFSWSWVDANAVFYNSLLTGLVWIHVSTANRVINEKFSSKSNFHQFMMISLKRFCEDLSCSPRTLMMMTCLMTLLPWGSCLMTVTVMIVTQKALLLLSLNYHQV